MSVRPEEAEGKWVDHPLWVRSHLVASARYYAQDTLGAAACKGAEMFLYGKHLADTPPDNACKNCLRSKTWRDRE